MILKNLRIYTVTSGIIENGYIVFDDKIIDFGEGEPKCENANSAIDCGGLLLTPGFIDAHTHLGLAEDSLDFIGDDTNEDSEPITPHLRAIDGINPFDRCFTEAREEGITTVAVAPGSANPIGGQVCVLKTFGKRIDSMLIKTPAAIKFALGENPKVTYHAKNLAPITRMATAALIREALLKAKRYLSELNRSLEDEDFDEPEFDMKSDALVPLLKGEIPAHFHAHRADDIFTAIRIAEEFSLDYVIIHCTEGHLIADELAELGTRAVVGPNLCERSKPELRELSPEIPKLLQSAGVKIALTTDHPVTPLNLLLLCAEMASRNGLSHEDALRSITINAAEILGLGERLGSIEIGKDADFVLFCGELFNGKVKEVFINGKSVKNSL